MTPEENIVNPEIDEPEGHSASAFLPPAPDVWVVVVDRAVSDGGDLQICEGVTVRVFRESHRAYEYAAALNRLYEAQSDLGEHPGDSNARVEGWYLY